MTRNLRRRLAVILTVLSVSLVLLYPFVGPVPEFRAEHGPYNSIIFGSELGHGHRIVIEVLTDKAVEKEVDRFIYKVSDLMKAERIRYKDIIRNSPESFSVILKFPDQETLFDGKVLQRLHSLRKLPAEGSEERRRIDLALKPEAIEDVKQKAVQETTENIRQRLRAYGLSTPDVTTSGKDRIIVNLPGSKAFADRALDIVKRSAGLEIRGLDTKGDVKAAIKGDVPRDKELMFQYTWDPSTLEMERTPYLVARRPLMTRDDMNVSSARVLEEQGNLWIALRFRPNRLYTSKWSPLSGEPQTTVMILDGTVCSTEKIREPVPGRTPELRLFLGRKRVSAVN